MANFIYALYGVHGSIIKYFDNDDDAKKWVWDKVNVKPRVSLDIDELKFFANIKYTIVLEHTSDIITDFKKSLESINPLLTFPGFAFNIKTDGNANYYNELRECIDKAASKITGYTTSSYSGFGCPDGSMTNSITAGDKVRHSRVDSWIEPKDSPFPIFKLDNPIPEDRQEFLYIVANVANPNSFKTKEFARRFHI